MWDARCRDCQTDGAEISRTDAQETRGAAMTTNTDWMALFLSALVGFATGWLICSLWAARMLDQVRQQMRRQIEMTDEMWRAQLNHVAASVEPIPTPLVRRAQQRLF